MVPSVVLPATSQAGIVFGQSSPLPRAQNLCSLGIRNQAGPRDARLSFLYPSESKKSWKPPQQDGESLPECQ